MSSLLTPTPITNRLLSALPPIEYEQLKTKCEAINLRNTQQLHKVGEPIDSIYFPMGSIISLIIPIDNKDNLEVALVGNEGMLGITIILEVRVAPFNAIVQGNGFAWRISVPDFLQALKTSPVLQRELKSYLYVSLSQFAQTAACNHFHQIEARLARWLLMTLDRTQSNTFHSTHVFLSYMLGVRRVGITKAANSLQKQNLITYHRGNITILNPEGLEAVSCSCYRTDRIVYERILGEVFIPPSPFISDM